MNDLFVILTRIPPCSVHNGIVTLASKVTMYTKWAVMQMPCKHVRDTSVCSVQGTTLVQAQTINNEICLAHQ